MSEPLPVDNPENLDFSSQFIQPKQTPSHEKLTVVEQIYHQLSSESPVSYAHSFSRVYPPTDEQIWERRLTATEEWTRIDFGWLKDKACSLFWIKNEEGRFPYLIPTEQMKAEAESKLLELGCGVGGSNLGIVSTGLVIPPNESFRATPLPDSIWYIRCHSGSAKYTLVALPR